MISDCLYTILNDQEVKNNLSNYEKVKYEELNEVVLKEAGKHPKLTAEMDKILKEASEISIRGGTSSFTPLDIPKGEPP